MSENTAQPLGYDAETDNKPISAYITNLGKYNEGALVGEWLPLPTTTEQVQEVFERIGIDGVRYEEFFITDYETSVGRLHEHLREYASLDELNYLATLIEELDSGEVEKFDAAIEYEDYTGSLEDIINLAENLDCYEFFPGIHTDEDLGYYWAEESGAYTIEQLGPLSQYIDHERYGRDIRLEEGGTFTDNGYIRSNQGSFIEYYRGDVPEEYKVFAYPDKRPEREAVQGYEIKQRALFENMRGVALAENPNAPQPFVTWMFTQDAAGKRDYEWGHYFSGADAAKDDFKTRCAEYAADHAGVRVIENWLQNAELGTEQNYNMIDGQINNLPPEREATRQGTMREKLDAAKEAAARQEVKPPLEKAKAREDIEK